MAGRQGWVLKVHSEANRGTSHTPLQHLLLLALGSQLLACAKGEWGQWPVGQWWLEARVLDLRSGTQALAWFLRSLSLSLIFKLT